MANIDDKELKKLEKLLNSTISNLLYGGAGDAGWSELAGAAACFKTLQVLGLTVKGEKDVRRELGGENVHDENFLETFEIQ